MPRRAKTLAPDPKKPPETPLVPRGRRARGDTVNEEGEALYDSINADENERWAKVEVEVKTRGEAKRKATQLERLGEALTKLKPGQLARVKMPDDLRASVVEAQRILAKKAWGGYRRQIQFIGRIMRTVDAQPIADALEAFALEGTRASQGFRQAERWREQLLAKGDEGIEGLVGEIPPGRKVDRTELRQLVRAAQKEKALPQKAPHAQRRLFRLLRGLFDTAVDLDDAADDGADDGAAGPGQRATETD